MAINKKRRATTTRRKTAKSGAKKRKSRVGAVVASPATVTISGHRFTKAACGLTKPQAQKKAEAHRAKGKGKLARVRPNAAGKGYCVYKRG